MTVLTAEEFVRELATAHPTVPGDEVNYCQYCGATWAEDDYAEYRERERTKKTRFLRAHHEDDCVWVRANEVMLG